MPALFNSAPKGARGQKAVACVCSLCLGLSLVTPAGAFADEESDLQAKVEETTKAYEEASERVEEAQANIADNEEKIAQIEEELPQKRERASAVIKSNYKMGETERLIDLVFSSEDFGSLIQAVYTMTAVTNRNNEIINDLVSTQEELQVTHDALSTELAEAEDAEAAAKKAMNDAIAARQEAAERAAEQARQEAAAAAAALAEAQRAAEQATTFTTETGNTATVETPAQTDTSSSSESSSSSEVSWSERDQFVSNWASRIDAYLAGSPLAGHGKTFAEAAWDYGVDPRWSPAISCIESSKGAICFKPHNAWGWGSSSWSDWDSAIRDHVKGLASGYGYTNSVASAQKYCPPNWSFWYSSVQSQMEMI